MSKTQTVQKTVPVSIKIKKLDVAESYFLGIAEFEGQEYKINIQGHLQDKLIKLPFKIAKRDELLVNLTGPKETFVDDILHYKGKSEWIEIDSQHILYYVADHQDKIDTLEIFV